MWILGVCICYVENRMHPICEARITGGGFKEVFKINSYLMECNFYEGSYGKSFDLGIFRIVLSPWLINMACVLLYRWHFLSNFHAMGSLMDVMIIIFLSIRVLKDFFRTNTLPHRYCFNVLYRMYVFWEFAWNHPLHQKLWIVLLFTRLSFDLY